jgi:predicted DNA-binding transcriptional regulator AlpA
MRMYTLPEVCDLLQVSKRTMMRRRAQGLPPRSLLIAGRIKYPDEDVDEFIAQRYREALYREDAIRQAQ